MNDPESVCVQRTGNGSTVLRAKVHAWKEAGSNGGKVGRSRPQGDSNAMPRHICFSVMCCKDDSGIVSGN